MTRTSFLRSGHWPTLASAFLYFDTSFMVWVLFGVLGAHIGGELGLSASEKGFLVAIPILGGALVRIPLGICVDRFGPRRTGLVAQVLVLVPLLCAWLFGRNLAELHAIGLLLGVAGGSFAVALPLASRWYPAEHQGLAMGIAGAGNSGTVVAALLAPRLAEAYGWHAVFGLALLPALVTLAVFFRFAKESPTQPMPKPLGAYLQLCRERDTLWFCLFYAFTFGGFVGLASLLVVFFHDQYGLAKVSAGNLTALCVFSGSFLRPIGGYLADRLGGARMLSLLFVCASVGAWLIGTLPELPVAVALLFCVMALLGMGNGSVFQLVPQRFGDRIGVATGIVGAAGGFGGFLLPSLFGWIRDLTGSYGPAFVAFGVAGIGCLVLLTTVQRGWSDGWLGDALAAARRLESVRSPVSLGGGAT